MIDLRSAHWVAADRYELRDDARRFENWENNYAALLGMGVAIDYAREIGLDAIEARVTTLAAELRRGISAVPGFTVYDIGWRRSGIVTSSHAEIPAGELEVRLREAGFMVSLSGPASTLIDAERRDLPELLRSSVHYCNHESEIAELVDFLGSL